MPIWAPVGGRPGVEMNGHSTGAWSEVIRHVDTGAVAAAQPRPARRCAASGCVAGTAAAVLASVAGIGAVGRSWPKSASSRSRPGRRAAGSGRNAWLVPRGVAGHAAPRRVRLTPRGTVEAANADVVGQVQPQRGEPGAADRRRPAGGRTRRSGRSWGR